MKENNQAGNSAGNIMNCGFAATSGEWIFFINPNDGNKIYRIRTDGTSSQLISSDYARCLNVLGDWLYYFKYKADSKGIQEYSIYKIHFDGSECQKIAAAGSMSYFMVDDWIYYTDYFDDQKLYRVQINRTNYEKLLDDNVGTLFCVVGSWIYFRTNTELCKIHVDGTDREVLDFIHTWNFVVDKDWIYYNNLKDFGCLYKIKIDGKGCQKLNNHASENMNVNMDWVYYNRTDEDNHLYRIGVDGTNNQQLNSDDTFGHNVVGDWIYYLIKSDDFAMYRIRTDGTERGSD